MATPFKRPTALGAIECTAAIGIPFAFDSEGMWAWLLLPVSVPHNTRVAQGSLLHPLRNLIMHLKFQELMHHPGCTC